MENRYQLIIKICFCFILIFSSINAFASILIESGSYGEIFPAKNGDMHIFIRNDNSSYIFYSGGRVVKEIPLGIGDSTITFETASSDGVGGAYVLYNNTENKTIYAQRYNSSGEALWDAPGSIVYTYTHPRVSSFSVLGPDSSFVVVYDDYFPIYVTPAAYLWMISPEGVVNSHESGRFNHSWNLEIHSDPYEVYIKQALTSYITPIYNFETFPYDTSKLGILEFDCDGNGYLYAIRTPLDLHLKRELQRYDIQLNPLWENPIVYYVEELYKTSSDPDYERPGVIANNDGSVVLYPTRYSEGWNFTRIDSSKEYVYSDLNLIGESDRVHTALSCSNGANLFLIEEWDTGNLSLIKVSIEGNIEFSTVLRNGFCRYASIIENKDSTYAIIMITSTDSVFVDKITDTGEILVRINEVDNPVQFTLHQNYPNPLNPTTTISYEIPEAQNIKLQIFDITGRLIKTLFDGFKEAGHWEHIWDASMQSSGIYIYRLTYGDRQISRKMVVLK